MLLCNALSLYNPLKTKQNLNYWPVLNFEVDLNNQDQLSTVLGAVKNERIGKIKIINIVCADYNDSDCMLLHFLNQVNAYEFKEIKICNNDHIVKLFLIFNVVIKKQSTLQHLITFFTSQYNRLNSGYKYRFHVILKHLTIKFVDYTHALLEVIPRKYLKSFKCDLSGFSIT